MTDYAKIFAEYDGSNGNGSNGGFKIPDIPTAALQGRLGEICFERMGDFPFAYSWIAMLAVASTMIEEKLSRTNLYCALVGPPHSGKSQAIERAMKILGINGGSVLQTMVGSGEQLVRCTNGAAGENRLLSPDELGHLFDKMHIENSSFPYILNRAYYQDRFEVLMAKKEKAMFDCSLSIVGGLVEETFDKSFNGATTGGLYDRFIFGYADLTSSFYDWRPFEGGAEELKVGRVVIDREVWEMKSSWLKTYREWNPRVVEHAIRCAIVCAAFDGKTCLRVEDLKPCYEMVRYQHMVRELLQPNPGENLEGRLALKFLNFLQRRRGKYIGRRELFLMTHAYNLGPSTADRALSILIANGDIQRTKVGKQIMVRLVTEAEHAAGTGPGEEA